MKIVVNWTDGCTAKNLIRILPPSRHALVHVSIMSTRDRYSGFISKTQKTQ